MKDMLRLSLLLVCLHIFTATGSYSQRWRHFQHLVKTNETVRRQLQENAKIYNQPPQPSFVEFNCVPQKSTEPPASAHRVRPADIKVVGAVGDSITAALGLGAADITDILREDRGESWSIGGDKDLTAEVTTLPNILKKFNPALEGFSFGEADVDDPGAKNNVAISGNEARDMMENVKKLVQRMQDDNGINFDEDWKMITFLIGGNDLCQYCEDQEAYSPDRYVGFVRESLNYLHANVPRAIVNLNTMFDITLLPAFSDGLGCDIIQDTVCYCAANKQHHAMLKDALVQYNRKLIELIDSGKYDTNEDFTVILQDHFSESEPPKEPGTGKVDRSFWAADCFHPGRKAHYAFGTSLWNTLLEPVGRKRSRVTWEIGGKLPCPTEDHPYIFTRLNSQPTNSSAVHRPSKLSSQQKVPSSGDETSPPGARGSALTVAVVALAVAVVAVLGVMGGVLSLCRRQGRRYRGAEAQMYDNDAFKRQPQEF